MGFLDLVDYFTNVGKYTVQLAKAVNVVVNTFLLVPLNEGLRL